MSARKFVQSAYLDSSAFIPLIDASNSLHNKIVNHLKETQLFPGIDTVVLSEVLAGVDGSVDRDELVEIYTRQFRVPSFDAQAAKVSAEIFRLLKSAGQIPRGKGMERQVTKADIMIVATAIVNSAAEFIYEDKHFKRYPELLPEKICGFPLPKFTRASDLPDVLVQTEMAGLETSQSMISQERNVSKVD